MANGSIIVLGAKNAKMFLKLIFTIEQETVVQYVVQYVFQRHLHKVKKK